MKHKEEIAYRVSGPTFTLRSLTDQSGLIAGGVGTCRHRWPGLGREGWIGHWVWRDHASRVGHPAGSIAMRTKIAPLQSDGGAGLHQSMGTSCRYRAGLSARHSAQGTLTYIYIH